MSERAKITVVVLFCIAVVFTCGLFIYKQNGRKFALSEQRIAQDLSGKSVSVNYSQFWPFDSSQELTATIVNRKSMGHDYLNLTGDDYVVLVVKVGAVAKVDKTKDGKELPSDKMRLSGLLRMTYERIGNKWYLMNVENISLKVEFVKNKS